MKFSILNSQAMDGRNKYQVEFLKLDIKRQVEVLLDLFGSDHQFRNKAVSDSTKRARRYVVFQFVEDVKKKGYPIKNIMNIGQKHVKAAVDVWLKSELSASTIQLRLSVLRWLVTSIGKSDMIQTPAYYGIKDDQIQRTYVATTDKSWVGSKVLSEELIGKVAEKDIWVAMNLKLMQHFGLRIRESVLIRPKYSDSETILTVEEGTKGGRTRSVPIRNDAQREVLNQAIQMASSNVRQAMVHPGKTPTQSIKRIYYVCSIFGITRDQLNITPHGLRHEYANDRYKEVSGMPSLVRGNFDVVNRHADHEARVSVTRELGHARTTITGAYTGSRVRGRTKFEKPTSVESSGTEA